MFEQAIGNTDPKCAGMALRVCSETGGFGLILAFIDTSPKLLPRSVVETAIGGMTQTLDPTKKAEVQARIQQAFEIVAEATAAAHDASGSGEALESADVHSLRLSVKDCYGQSMTTANPKFQMLLNEFKKTQLQRCYR